MARRWQTLGEKNGEKHRHPLRPRSSYRRTSVTWNILLHTTQTHDASRCSKKDFGSRQKCVQPPQQRYARALTSPVLLQQRAPVAKMTFCWRTSPVPRVAYQPTDPAYVGTLGAELRGWSFASLSPFNILHRFQGPHFTCPPVSCCDSRILLDKASRSAMRDPKGLNA